MGLRKVLPPGQKPLQADNSLFIVNIVLLLILFFLATGQLMNSRDVPVLLSKTTELDIESLPKPLLLVGADGALTLDGTDLSSQEAAETLAQLSLVHVLIEGEAPATRLIDLMARPELEKVEVRLVTIHYRGEGA
ncbi:biopolymer transporter ExbD [Aliiroseovarius sp.]|uniref:biopolymer transporter ExbD n=1 Tax=Aliiroseovarius sp. TaxID=1872442 RepID=UPI003BA90428